MEAIPCQLLVDLGMPYRTRQTMAQKTKTIIFARATLGGFVRFSHSKVLGYTHVSLHESILFPVYCMMMILPCAESALLTLFLG